MSLRLRLAAIGGVLAVVASACSFDLSLPDAPQWGAITGSLELSGHVPADGGYTVALVDSKGSSETRVTSETAAFTFNNLMPGQYYVETKVPGFEKFVRPNIAVKAGQTVELGALKLEWQQGSAAEGIISGTVGVAGGGGSAAGGQVDFILEGVNQRLAIAAIGSDGTFVQRLPPGSYSLKASHPSFVTKIVTGVVLKDAEDKQLSDPILLELNPATVTGTVTKEVDGLAPVPAQGVTVTVGSGTSTTDQNGNFQVTGLAAGTYGIRFSLTGFHDPAIEHPVVLKPAQTTAAGTTQLMLNRGTITGRVEVSDGTSVAEVNVSVANSAYTAVVSPDTADPAKGSFRIAAVPVGTYSVVATRQRYSSATATGITVTHGLTTNIASPLVLALLAGDFQVDDGDPASLTGYVNNTALTIRLNNVSNAAKYRVSEDAAFSDMQTFQNLSGNTISWTLTSSTQGVHTIYLQYQDTSGTNSPTLSTNVVLDSLRPTAQLEINGGALYTRDQAPQTLTLGVSGNGTGSTLYQMIVGPSLQSDGGVAGSVQPFLPFSSFVRAAPALDGVQTMHAQVMDQAGNLSTPISASITVDTQAPTGSIAIRKGAAAALAGYTNDDDVIIDQTYGGETNLLIRMANSSAALQTAVLVPVQPATGWRLEPQEGSRTVYAELFDPAGNKSNALTHSIIYDVTAPSPVGVSVVSDAVTSDAGVTLQFATPGEALAPDAGVVLSESLLFSGPTTVGPFGFPASSRAVYPVSTGSDGLKTIYASFRDIAGNSSVAEASVTLDRVAPSGTISLTGTLGDGTASTDRTSSASVTLSLNLQGATGYLLGNDTLTSCPPTASSYTPLNNASSLSVTLSGTASPRVVRLCLRDDANHITGPLEDTIALDAAPPTSCAMTLEAQRGSAGWLSNGFTSSNTVRARFSGCSETPAELALVESATAPSCTSPSLTWTPFADPAAIVLSSGQGTKTLHACVRDATRNSAALAQRTLVLDTTAPTLSLSLTTPSPTNSGSAAIAVTAADTGGSALGADALTASEDSLFVSQVTGPTANATSLTVTLSAGDGQKRVYVRARDGAGNETVDSVLLTRDATPPTAGTISLFGTLGDGSESAAIATSPTVQAALTATDATGYLFTTAASCPTTGYTALPSGRVSATLAGTGASRTVSVCFRDDAGNVSAAPVTDSIGFDSVGPAGCLLSLEAQRDSTWTAASSTFSETIRARFGSCVEVPAEIVTAEGALDCSSPSLTWRTFEDPSAVNLSGTEGTKTVRACVRDAARNPVALSAQTIVLDKTAPTLALTLTTPSPTSGGNAVISVSAADTGGSTLGNDALAASEDGSFGTLSVGPTPNATSITVPISAGDGPKVIYVRARDRAGNQVIRSVTIDRDTFPPTTGAVAIFGALGDGSESATVATSTAVTVALGATDATEYLFSTAASCPTTGYVAIPAARVATTLNGTGATRSVSVCFRDGAGNVTAAPVTDTIGFDNAAPSSCALSLEAQRGSTLWTASSATNSETIRARISGCAETPAEMVVVEGALSCTSPTLSWQPFADPLTLVLSSTEGSKTVRACVRDQNRNAVALTDQLITLDETAPTLSLSLTTASPTNGSTAVVAVTAADTGGSSLGSDALTASEDPSFLSSLTGPTANTTSMTVTLSTGDGQKRIYVRARDGAGNETVDSVLITRDATIPTGGVITIYGALGDGAESAAVATSTSVDVALSSNDATSYVLTSAASCPTSGYTALPTGRVSATLVGTGTTRTVSVCFRDDAGNVSAAPLSDSITFDNTPPSGCALSLEALRDSTWAASGFSSSETIRARFGGCVEVPAEIVTAEGALDCASASLTWKPFEDPSTVNLSSSEGSKTVRACVRDSARNPLALTAQTLTLDKTAPTLTVSLTTTSPTAGSSAALSITAADTGGAAFGSDALTASEDGSFATIAIGPTANATALTVPLSTGDGTKTIYVRARDRAGNQLVKSVTIDRDTAAPATGAVAIYGTLGDGTESTAVATSTAVTLALTATDATEYLFSTAASCPTTGYVAIPAARVATTLNGTGATRSVSVCFRDGAGNVTAAPVADTITYDDAAPASCALSLEAQRASTSWTTSSATKNETIRARITGCGETPVEMLVVEGVLSCTSPGLTWQPFADPVTLVLSSAEGSKTVRACVRDGNRNAVALTDQGITLDKTAPTLSLTLTTTSPTSGATAAINVSAVDTGGSALGADALTASEDSSFLSALTGPMANAASINVPLSSGDGQKRIYVRARDGAGNETVDSVLITRDTVIPSSGTILVYGALGDGTESTTTATSTSVEVALSATDATGYILTSAASCPTSGYTSLPSGRVSATLNGTGATRSVSVCFRDDAGNVSAAPVSDSIAFDNAPPLSCALTLEALRDGAWAVSGNTSSETIRTRIGGCAETPFEIATAEATLNCLTTNLWKPYVDPSELGLTSTEETKVVRACVRDAARNPLALSTQSIVLDKTAPTLTVSLTTVSPTAGSTAGISVTAADTGGSLLGADALTVSEDSTFATAAVGPTANTTALTVPLSSGDGVKTLYVRARDGAGNQTVKTLTIEKDSADPVTGTVVISGVLGDGSASTATATLTTVSVAISSTDASEYLLTTAATCPTTGYSTITAAPVSTTLNGSGATRSVSVCFRDQAGNVTDVPVVDTIAFDNAPPAACALSLEAQRPGSTQWLSAIATADETIRARITGCVDVPSEMVILEGALTCTTAGLNWQTFADPYTLILSSGQASKTVRACVRDSARNPVALTAQSITLDETAPTLSISLTTTSPTNGSSATLSVTAADTGGSGLGADALTASEDSAFTSGNVGPTANTTSLVFSPLSTGDGQKRIYVRVRDGAGNELVKSVTIDRDTTAPATGTVTIYGELGDGSESTTHSTTADVEVALGATDATEYALTATGACPTTGFSTLTAGRVSTTLVGASATRTVSVCFRDAAGNITAAPVTDSITFDNAAPTLCTLSLEALRAGVWTDNGYTNSGSIRARLSTCIENPAEIATVVGTSCTGSLSWVPFTTSVDVTIPTTPISHSVTVCARDAQFNVGAIGTPTIIYDATAPSITSSGITGGAVTSATQVTVTLTASDSASGIGGADALTLSEDDNFQDSTTKVYAYAPSKTFDLSTGEGDKPIYLRVRDAAGNEAYATLPLNVDRTAPSGSIVVEGYLADGTPSQTYATTFSGSPPTVKAYLTHDDAVRYAIGNETIDCATATYTALTSTTLTTTLNGSGATAKEVRVCLEDAAGNRNSSGSIRDDIGYEPSAPTGCTLALQGFLADGRTTVTGGKTGAPFVDATLDDCSSGAVEYYLVSGSVTCSALVSLPYVSYSAPQLTRVLLTGGEGTNTVTGCVRDAARNVATLPAPTITLDQTAPVAFGLSINTDDGYVNAADLDGGYIQVLVEASASGAATWVYSEDESFPSTGTPPPFSTYLVLADAGTRTVFAKFFDDMGNASSVVSDSIEVDVEKPELSRAELRIDSANSFGYVRDTSITVGAVAPLDAVNMNLVRDSNGAPFCTEADFTGAEVQSIANQYSFALSSVEGEQLVCARWFDAAGNPSDALFATTTLDMTSPQQPVILTPDRTFNPFSVGQSINQNVSIAFDTKDPDHAAWEVLGGVTHPAWKALLPVIPGGVDAGVGFFTFEVRVSDAGVASAGLPNVLRVRERDRAGNTSGESSVVLTTDIVPPEGVTTDVFWIDNGFSKATVHWLNNFTQSSSDIVGFNIYYGTATGDGGVDNYRGLYADQGQSPVRVNMQSNATLSGLPNGASTYVVIRAVDRAGNVGASHAGPKELELQPNIVSTNWIQEMVPYTDAGVSSSFNPRIDRIVRYGQYGYALGIHDPAGCAPGQTVIQPFDLGSIASPIQSGTPRTNLPRMTLYAPIVNNETFCSFGGARGGDLAIEPPYLFVASSSKLRIYSLTIPTAPVEIAKIDFSQASTVGHPNATLVNAVQVSGRHAYVAGQGSQIYHVDLSSLYDNDSTSFPKLTSIKGSSNTGNSINGLTWTRNRLIANSAATSGSSQTFWNLAPSLDGGTAFSNAAQMGFAGAPAVIGTNHSDHMMSGQLYMGFGEEAANICDADGLYAGLVAGTPLATIAPAPVTGQGQMSWAGAQFFANDYNLPGIRTVDLSEFLEAGNNVYDNGLVRTPDVGLASEIGQISQTLFGNYLIAGTKDRKLRAFEIATPRALRLLTTAIGGGSRIEVENGLIYTSGGVVLDLMKGPVPTPIDPVVAGFRGTYDTVRFDDTMVLAFRNYVQFVPLEATTDRKTSTVYNPTAGSTMSFTGIRPTGMERFGNYLVVAEVRSPPAAASNSIWIDVFDASKLRLGSHDRVLTTADRVAQYQVANYSGTIDSLGVDLTISSGRALLTSYAVDNPSTISYVVDIRPMVDDDSSTSMSTDSVQAAFTLDRASAGVIQGDFAFVVSEHDTTGGLYAFKVDRAMDELPTTKNLGAPVAGSILIPYANSLAVHGPYVYVTPYNAKADGIKVVDIQDPQSPRVVTSYPYRLSRQNAFDACSLGPSPTNDVLITPSSTVVAGSRLYVSTIDRLDIFELE